jgi:hypothetical protein
LVKAVLESDEVNNASTTIVFHCGFKFYHHCLKEGGKEIKKEIKMGKELKKLSRRRKMKITPLSI